MYEDAEDLLDEELENIDDYYLSFEIANQKYAIHIANITGLYQVGDIVKLPDEQEYIRGLIKINNEPIKLIDTRVRLGFEALVLEIEALVNMLKQREQEHKDWLSELELSINENREFRLTTDPHACNFGKWYDSYSTNNEMIANLLKRFDTPHKQIHEIAERARSLVNSGKREDALTLIAQTKDNELKLMISLFSRLYQMIYENSREISIIIDTGEEQVALAADRIENIHNFEPEQIDYERGNKLIDGYVNTDEDTYIILKDDILKIIYN